MAARYSIFNFALTRAIVLSLLAGLFFSAGEGIRLVPFGGRSDVNAGISFGKTQKYNLALLRSVSSSKHLSFKFLKKKSAPEGAGPIATGHFPLPVNDALPSPPAFSNSSGAAELSGARSSIKSRAPPIA